MNIQIDNYYITTNTDGYMKICIGGQNIIHDRPNCKTRKEVIDYGVSAIKEYNERHKLKWGEVGG